MIYFTTDMVYYFTDLSIRNTQHTNWQDSLWVVASGSPANIGHLCPSELHRGTRHSLQTLGFWCPSELHWGIRHPLQALGIWCPKHWASGALVNFTGEYGIPCKHWASGAPVNFTREYGIPYKHWASVPH